MATAIAVPLEGSSAEDQRLIRAIRAGDLTAFNQLYRKYFRRVRGYARGLLSGDYDMAEDIAQEVFIRVSRAINNGSAPDVQFQPWVIIVTRNLAIDLLRRAKTRPSESLLSEDLLQRSTRSCESEVLTRAEIQVALTRLREPHRRVIILKFFQELSEHEIAAILGTSLGTVKSRTHYALRALERIIFAGAAV